MPVTVLVGIIPYLVMFIINKSESANAVIFFISYGCSIFSVLLLGVIYINRTKQSIFHLFKFALSATLAAGAAFSVGYFLEKLL